MAGTIGCLIMDLEGLTLTPDEREMLRNPLVGGVILFARNYHNPQQVTQLTKDIRACRKEPLLVMVDQEGGRVQRFIDGFTRIPAMGQLTEGYTESPGTALNHIKEIGWLMAYEILLTGIDLSLAPVLDLNRGINPAIGKRAFSDDPVVVSMFASFFCQGMDEAGMASTGKHFPGHGGVAQDSHVSMPVDERSIDELSLSDLLPFKNLINDGALRAMLVSHVIFPQIDNQPAGFSPHWVKRILRQQMKFHGAILTDDLSMEGGKISSNPTDRILAAREAGCDFALLCNHREGVIQALDTMNAEQHQVHADVWQPLQGDFLRAHSYTATKRQKNAQNLLQQLMEKVQQ